MRSSPLSRNTPLRVRVENGIMQHKLLLGSTALRERWYSDGRAAPAKASTSRSCSAATPSSSSRRAPGTRSRTVASIRERSEVTAGTCSAWTTGSISRPTARPTAASSMAARSGSTSGSGGINGGAFDTSTDEAALFFSGNFGRWELGLEDGAEDVMFVGGQAQAGTGGLDGAQTLAPSRCPIPTMPPRSPTSPRVAGFQLGASFAGLRGAPARRRSLSGVAVTRARTASAAAPTGWARWARWISRFPAWCCGRTADQLHQQYARLWGGFGDDELNYGVASCSASAASRSAPATSTAMPFQALPGRHRQRRPEVRLRRRACQRRLQLQHS